MSHFLPIKAESCALPHYRTALLTMIQELCPVMLYSSCPTTPCIIHKPLSLREEGSPIYPSSCLHRDKTPGPSAHFQLSTPIPCMLHMKPLENLFLPKLYVAKIALCVGQLLEKSELRIGSLSEQKMTTSCPGIITYLICHPWDPLVLMAEIPQKYFLFPIFPTAIRSFLFISFLIFLRPKSLISIGDIYIFHPAGIWLREPPEVFQGESEHIGCFRPLAGLYMKARLRDLSQEGSLCLSVKCQWRKVLNMLKHLVQLSLCLAYKSIGSSTSD